ncbi:DUF4394 domain-containing protein [Rhizobium halophytocola]|uniref:DUF4394 domain-containing protein n=1 Tax=Rhizobium halophytocola TaxID=735519 RepID=A0ABS4E5D7_9HYPH|nr:DUF4394 domain-containing protein [Rhizobium halophytocola]MBP1853166.1 hypothetical protein [Rhizobium halophytocola]
MYTFSLACLTATLAASSALAAPALGLVGDRTLVMFDTDSPGTTSTVEISGVETLVGLDFRPATKTIVGVTSDHSIVTIDPESGAATQVAKMDTPLDIGDAPVIVNFNPAADRIRYMSGVTNHRVHPDTGAVTVDGSLAFEEMDMHKGETPNTVAAAYTNSTGKPEKTAMYNIDATIGALIQQTKPNDGTLKAIGKLGIEGKPASYAFDIQATGDSGNVAWLVADNGLYTVDLSTGKATSAGMIGGLDAPMKSITVMPAL